MNLRNTLITAFFIAATYSGFASAVLLPTINTDRPLAFDVAEALSEVRPELNCTYNPGTKDTQCERPDNMYTCQVIKKPGLLTSYYSSITTIEEFRNVSSAKGLKNCVAGAGW